MKIMDLSRETAMGGEAEGSIAIYQHADHLATRRPSGPICVLRRRMRCRTAYYVKIPALNVLRLGIQQMIT
jgi:hypothetical protein